MRIMTKDFQVRIFSTVSPEARRTALAIVYALLLGLSEQKQTASFVTTMDGDTREAVTDAHIKEDSAL
jgi:hypothetical protein